MNSSFGIANAAEFTGGFRPTDGSPMTGNLPPSSVGALAASLTSLAQRGDIGHDDVRGTAGRCTLSIASLTGREHVGHGARLTGMTGEACQVTTSLQHRDAPAIRKYK